MKDLSLFTFSASLLCIHLGHVQIFVENMGKKKMRSARLSCMEVVLDIYGAFCSWLCCAPVIRLQEQRKRQKRKFIFFSHEWIDGLAHLAVSFSEDRRRDEHPRLISDQSRFAAFFLIGLEFLISTRASYFWRITPFFPHSAGHLAVNCPVCRFPVDQTSFQRLRLPFVESTRRRIRYKTYKEKVNSRCVLGVEDPTRGETDRMRGVILLLRVR